MRRREREREARRQTYIASQQNYWTPTNGMTIDDYLKIVKQHSPIAEMLEYLEKHPRDWQIDGGEFEFTESKEGVCEKCAVRELGTEWAELKVATKCLDGGAEVQFSRYAAERFARDKPSTILTPNLHRDFVYQSWVEAAHLEHIKQHRDEPGIMAVFAHPAMEEDGKLSLALSMRAVDGSHRAALTYREDKPFSVRVLTPVETLKSIFSINNKKNPFFALQYSPEVDDILEQMARGGVGPHAPLR